MELPDQSINQAIIAFANFDIIVFGAGLEAGTHPDHNNTVAIISGLKKTKSSIKIYGYVDLGVNNGTNNYTAPQYKQQIDGWNAMGVDGIFGDDFGGDFGVTRARQNDFIAYVHNLSLSVFANSYFVGDALGNSSKLNNNDYYLYEPILISRGAYTSFDDFKRKADSAYFYMKTMGIGIATVLTVSATELSSITNKSDKFTLGWYSTSIYDF